MRKILCFCLLLGFAVAAAAGIRGHKWGESPEQSRLIEAAKKSTISTPLDSFNGQKTAKYQCFSGKIGTLPVTLRFYYWNNQLIQISIEAGDFNHANEISKQVIDKYNLPSGIDPNPNPLPGHHGTQAVFSRYNADSVDANLNVDALKKKVTIFGGVVGLHEYERYVHSVENHQVYIDISDRDVSYTSMVLFDRFYKTLTDKAAAIEKKLTSANQIKDDL